MTRPAVTSYSRGTSAVSVVLPEPVAPTTATVSPGCDLEVDVAQHRLVGLRPGSAKPTPSKRRCPRGAVEHPVAGRRSTGSVSKISLIRAAAVIASCAIARM